MTLKKTKITATCHHSRLTGLCFTAGFLSVGFLAASDTFLTVKGTPYLLAGLVIFWAGASGMEPGAERLAGERNEKYTNDYPSRHSAAKTTCSCAMCNTNK